MAIQDDNTILNKGDLKAYHEAIAPMLGGTFMVSTNNSDYYSTDEKVVGVWTDGKPVYQKTFIISKASFTKVSDYRYEYSISSLNIDKLIKADSVASVGTDGQGVSPGIVFTNNSINNPWNYGVLVIHSKIIMSLQADVISNGGFSSVTTTIRYTKTTDTASTALTTPGAYDINFPNTWPENKEIFLGNGVYGYRAAGNYTTAISAGSNTWTMIADNSTGLTTNKPILSYGGNLETYSSSGVSNTPACVPRAGSFNSCIYIANAGTFRIQAISPSGSSLSIRTTDKYDVWITYIK